MSVVPLPDTDRRVARERQQQQQQMKLSVLGVHDTPMRVVVWDPAGQPLAFSRTERRMRPPPQSTGGMGRNSLRSRLHHFIKQVMELELCPQFGVQLCELRLHAPHTLDLHANNRINGETKTRHNKCLVTSSVL